MPGAYGFYGVADVLSGEVNPSGHLPDTYAVVNANSTVGSREGAAGWDYADEVTYPFGYGLSYTTFTQELKSLEVDLEKRMVTAAVEVTNTGNVAGKDSVQLYVAVPYTEYDVQNQVEKSAIQLLDYEKTDLLEPGETVEVVFEADAQDMASYNSKETGVDGDLGTYILDAGTYYFSVGNGVHQALNNILEAQGHETQAAGVSPKGNKENVRTWELEELDKTTFMKSRRMTSRR